MPSIFGYAATPKGAGRDGTLELARAGAIWVPGPLIVVDPGVHPGDVLVLFFRDSPASPAGELLGAGRVRDPGTRSWGGRAWLETISADDSLYKLAVHVGYRGPRNYMTMTRLERFTEEALEIQRLLGEGAPLLEPGERVFGLPAHAFVFRLPIGDLVSVEGDEARVLERITEDRAVLGGKPTIRRKRIAVEHVLGWLATGSTTADILREFPELETDDLRACLLFARKLVQRHRAAASTLLSSAA
jgi:uncharacterized protein (DUF433 family)